MDLQLLKSGTDIRGTALEGCGEPVTLTDEAVTALTHAFVVFLKAKYAGGDICVGVGSDPRLSSDNIREKIISALKKAGTDIKDASLTSTPAVFMMTKDPEINCHGSIMVTASHHPRQKNGMKFFTRDGGLNSEQLGEVIALAEKGEQIEGTKTMLYRKDFTSAYAAGLVEKVRTECGAELPLEGFKIVVDAGNGSGGFYVEKVLKPLGADTTGSQFLEPDGNFPNHAPNPEDKTAMASISRCVLDNKADLGIIFDTDVDRAAVVAPDGKEINRNRLIALISAILLEETPDAYIVTDSITSTGLKDFIIRKKGYHLRYKRGYMNVISQAKKLNDEGRNAILAIETSGHAAFKENYFLDDGAYLVTRILIKMAKLKKEDKTLMSLIDTLAEPLEQSEIRLNILGENWRADGERIIAALTDFSKSIFQPESSTYEGVRANVDYADGWFLVRMSVHDPVMPINIESNKAGGVKLIAKVLYKFLSAYAALDCGPLERESDI